jgi:hypothetical protein
LIELTGTFFALAPNAPLTARVSMTSQSSVEFALADDKHGAALREYVKARLPA